MMILAISYPPETDINPICNVFYEVEDLKVRYIIDCDEEHRLPGILVVDSIMSTTDSLCNRNDMAALEMIERSQNTPVIPCIQESDIGQEWILAV